MNVAAVEAWLQAFAGLDAATLGAGAVARAARDRIEAGGHASAEDYVAHLARSADERHALLDRVVVPETWFFRDRPALDAVARHVVETWGPANPGAKFRVLSVPCSSGEEPYSLAMACALAGWPLERLHIDALDIGRENLTRARAGLYGRNSFRGDLGPVRAAFFSGATADTWRIADRVRAPVHFAAGNLLASDFALGRLPYDAIFCRNLLIYFDRETQARAIRTLGALLAPGGWIAVGPAEPVLWFEHGYEALKVRAGFVLQRATPRPRGRTRTSAPFATPAPLASRSASPFALPTAPARKIPARPAATVAPFAPEPAKANAPESLAALEQLADAGRLREATALGERLLAQAGPSARLLFLLAVVAEADGDTARAEALFRKTVYLEPHHAEALAHLALLAEKSGDARGAAGFRARARRHALKEVVA
ncbi:MAG: hypothetical protein RLZZ15_3381 [Verrucomicrobiota bacterium]